MKPRVIVVPVPIANPFPYVSTDVKEPVGIRRVFLNGSDPGKAIESTVAARHGKATLIDVGLVLAIQLDLIPPRIELT